MSCVSRECAVTGAAPSRKDSSPSDAHSTTSRLQRQDWLVIGISGVTCGGKTTLARRLLSSIAQSYLFGQDFYFLSDDDPRHVRVPGLEHNNYDILSALDMERMHRDVLSTLSGTDRSHEQHPSPPSPTAMQLPGKRLLIIEGFSVLNYAPLMELCDLRYYLVLEYGECAARRALRLYDPPDVAGYFDACVWPEHVKYRKEIEKHPGVVFIDGRDPDALDRVMQDLRPMGLKPTA